MRNAKLALLIAMVLVASGVLNAQSTQPINFLAPYAFAAGDQVLPAGEYIVRVPSVTGVLSISSKDGGQRAFVSTVPIEKLIPATKFKLIFHRYGTQYYLSEIWAPGYRTGRILIPNTMEMEQNLRPQHVTLYAQQRF